MNFLQRTLAQSKQILAISLPLILAELVGSVSGLVGTLMISRLGDQSLAALGLVNTTFITLMASSWGVIFSVGVLTAQAYGAKQYQSISQTVGQGFWLAIFLAIPMALLLKFATPIFLLLQQNPTTVAAAQTCFDPLVWGVLPVLWAGVLQQFIVALKHSRVVLLCTVSSMLLGIPVNYILIFGKLGIPALGLAGMGWATTVVHIYMLCFMIGYVMMIREYREYRVFAAALRAHWQRLCELFSVGWAIGAMLGVEICGLLAAALLCGLLGNQALASYQIAMQCMITSIMVPWGLAQGTTILVGHARGENNLAKAKQTGYTSMLLATVATLVVALVFWRFPTLIIRLFMSLDNPANAPLINLLIPILGIVGFATLFDGIRIVASGALRGLKDTRAALLIGFIGFWLIGLPVGYWLAFQQHWGPAGIWTGDLMGVAFGALILIMRFHLLLKQPGSRV